MASSKDWVGAIANGPHYNDLCTIPDSPDCWTINRAMMVSCHSHAHRQAPNYHYVAIWWYTSMLYSGYYMWLASEICTINYLDVQLFYLNCISVIKIMFPPLLELPSNFLYQELKETFFWDIQNKTLKYPTTDAIWSTQCGVCSRKFVWRLHHLYICTIFLQHPYSH